MLKVFLQGKYFRHPIHPALVHFPIGLFILSLVLDGLSYIIDGSGLSNLYRASFYSMILGFGVGILTGLTGFVDRNDIRLDHPARKTVNIHMTLNLASLTLFGFNLFLRSSSLDFSTTPLVPLLLSVIGVGTLLVSGYLGGTMVYDDGIGVGRHRRFTCLPRRTLNVSMFERKDGWVPVCDEKDLVDGQTLRINLNGTIIAIARQEGKVYAFQEFCTHRYGPLSEGKLEGHVVECPWHRSCFDIRNGKVVEGPAKVDLKTYSANIRSGKVFIR